MKESLACILFHKSEWPFEQLLAAIKILAASSACKTIFCPGYFGGPREARILQAAIGKKTRFFSISRHASWEDAVNRLLQSGALRDELLLFYSTECLPDGNCIDQMAMELLANEAVAGVNPVFINIGKDWLQQAGIVADSGGFLHPLYPGLPFSSPLAAKKRDFQVADFTLLCARKSDVRKTFGLDPKLSGMAGLALSAQIASASGKPFCVLPEAAALLQSNYSSVASYWLWNSFTLRGKIPQGFLGVDYGNIVFGDGLEYGVDEWLNEGPVNLPLHDAAAPNGLTALLRHLNPHTLLAWLAQCPDYSLAEIIERIRGLPYCLPHVFSWYYARAETQEAYARNNGFNAMLRQCREWRKNSRRFHYSILRPGMRVLQKANIYNSCLDYCPSIYDAWLELKAETPAPIEEGACWPTIAVVMPVWNPEPDFLRQAIESVLAQSNSNWELCIADDCSSRAGIKELLEAFAREDSRIKTFFRSENGHISLATNSALELVNAPWAAFMDHDDMLAKSALAFMAREIAEQPRAKFIYSDEDHIDAQNVRRSPIFKPGFDYALLFAGHLSCFRMDVLRKVNFLRPGLEGFQDSDLTMRMSALLRQDETRHISQILYHWRIHSGSTSMGLGVKPYIRAANIRAVEDQLAARGMAGKAAKRFSHIYQKFFAPRNLEDCAIILLNGGKPNWVLIMLARVLAEEGDMELFCQPFGEREPDAIDGCKALPFCGPSWREAIAQAAQLIDKKYLLFLDASLLPVEDCGLAQLLLAAKFWQAGMVGAYFWKNGNLWSAGQFPDASGLPFPLLRGWPREEAIFSSWLWLDLAHRAIGIPWQCMALERKVFLESGGFNAEMADFAMADLCLRLEERGKFTIVNPWVNFEIGALEPPESKGRELFFTKWGEVVATHPLRNANLKRGADYDWTLIFEH